MKHILFKWIILGFSIHFFNLDAQVTQVKVAAYDGIFIAGFVDQGGFSNFTGPNINAQYKQSKIILSALPSLRYKEDESTPKNSFVTPSLGIGITYAYRFLAIQIPFYYTAKTARENGKWEIGIGAGVRLRKR